MITLPDEWEYFYEEMIERATQFIRIDYWDITEDDLNLWLQNFKSKEEKFLSGLLIYRLTYRNETAMLSMYHFIIEMLLPEILDKHNIHTIDSISSFHHTLKHNPWSLQFRFSTIDNVDNNPAKSGAHLLRLFQRKGSFHKQLQISTHMLSTLPENIKSIILFDDITGTGEQFCTYMENVKEYKEKFLFIYCPLAAHEDAITNIAATHPECIVLPVELFNQNHSFFSNALLPQIAENIKEDDLKNLYLETMKNKTKRKENNLGRGEQALVHLFAMSSPNNSLPILTHHEETWNNLFAR